MKHRVDFGLYSFSGSISPQLAEKTGFSKEDAEEIKKALVELFEGDASSARPDGSMEVLKVYWWEHANPHGQYSAAKVHNTINIEMKKDVSIPKDVDDFVISQTDLDGLVPEVLEGR